MADTPALLAVSAAAAARPEATALDGRMPESADPTAEGSWEAPTALST
jgi:hypothetical protein